MIKRRFVQSFAGLAAFLAMTPALAATEAYLSSTGSGAACTLAAPCSSVATAVIAAGVGGEVICLNKGAYGSNITFPINQSVTISCGDGWLEAPHGQIDINTPPGSNVVIEGLVMDGEASGCCNLTYSGQGTLELRNVRSGNITGANSHGLRYLPSGNATLIVSDSHFYNNGGHGILVAPTAGTANVVIGNTTFSKNGQVGMLVQPTATGSAQVVIDGLKSAGNVGGVAAVATSANRVKIEIRNSTIAENVSYGVYSRSVAGDGSKIVVESCSVSGNTGAALYSRGSKSDVRVSKSTITGNSTGLFFTEGGQLLSYGNNLLSNSAPGTGPSATIGLQ